MHNATCPQTEQLEICERCSCIVRPPKEWEIEEFRIIETLEQLRATTCQLCQFFATIIVRPINSNDIRFPETRDIWVILCKPGRDDETARLFVSPGPDVIVTYDSNVKRQMLPAADLKKISYEKLKRWLNENKASGHFTADGYTAGLKVIDCNADPPEIVEAPRDCLYIALSYVWGECAQSVSFRAGDKLTKELPKTIADSVEVTRNLGLQYLWIDRYVS